VTHGGLPCDVPQSWSKAIHRHPDRPDGIAYRARHDDEAFCYAIYDNVASHIEEHSPDVDIERDWFWLVAEQYGLGLAPFSRWPAAPHSTLSPIGRKVVETNAHPGRTRRDDLS